MAWLAEVRVSPTEPLGNGAAKLAFVLNKVHAMRLAILDAATHTYSCTLTTDQFLLLEVLVVILSSLTVLHTSEIRVIALIALIIREPLHSISLQVIVECISWLL